MLPNQVPFVWREPLGFGDSARAPTRRIGCGRVLQIRTATAYLPGESAYSSRRAGVLVGDDITDADHHPKQRLSVSIYTIAAIRLRWIPSRHRRRAIHAVAEIHVRRIRNDGLG
jgi:hypothetical protein